MSEPVEPGPGRPGGAEFDPEKAPLRASDFPGCQAIHIPPEKIESHEGRLEYWEARTGTAIVCEPVSPYHERPATRLSALTRLIAASRGAPIETLGASDLVRFGNVLPFDRLLQADQIVFLDAPGLEDFDTKIDVDGPLLPDVVLEVDCTTDARRRKLSLYEFWGFPEVWIEVPDIRSPSQPRSRLPGTTIHVLEAGRFRIADSSRAFPGWTAAEIHRALNEDAMSHRTSEALHRVGRALAERSGAGPDRDPWLRRHRDEGRAEGRVEGRAEGRWAAAVAVLAARGIATTSALAERSAGFSDLPAEALMRAALDCRTEDEFRDLCPSRPDD